MKKKIKELIEVLNLQFDEYDRYWYKGTNSKTLKEESGDMTYHVGILLQAFSWMYKKEPKIAKVFLKKIFSYLKNVSYTSQFGKFYGRGFFLSTEQALPSKTKGQKWIIYEDKIIRVDLSSDAIMALLAGLYWCKKLVDDKEIKIECLATIANIFSYYKKTNFRVLHPYSKKLMRFGNHENIIPIKELVYILQGLSYELTFFDKIRKWFFENMRTYLEPIISKQERFAYNNYMFTMLLVCLYDYNGSYKKGLTNLLKETQNEYNLFHHKINNYYKLLKTYLYANNLPLINFENEILESIIKQTGALCYESKNPLPLKERKFYNRFEKSAYIKCIDEVVNNYICNEDLLQAYYMFEEDI